MDFHSAFFGNPVGDKTCLFCGKYASVTVQHLFFDHCVSVENSNLVSQILVVKFGSGLSQLLDGGLFINNRKNMMREKYVVSVIPWSRI